uniref:Uncharacterized protein n=1 Tax=Corethron hystrix TaxID=216773 RepID=A0A7S1BZB0_9STRA|mmetsp:Transcript_6362/g.13752  ORF Transcript_6362/g.13752 Transcript_6362/m.13752 type:complete len:234 (+) Transcript_6362:62-763(+)
MIFFLRTWNYAGVFTVIFPIFFFHLIQWCDLDYWQERSERQYRQQYDYNYNYGYGNERWWETGEGGWFGGGQNSWWGSGGPDEGISTFFMYLFSLVIFVLLVLFGNAIIDHSNQGPFFASYLRNIGQTSERNEGLLLGGLFLFGFFCLSRSLSLFVSNMDFRAFLEEGTAEDLWLPRQFLPQTYLLWSMFCFIFFFKLKNSLLASTSSPPVSGENYVEMKEPSQKNDCNKTTV